MLLLLINKTLKDDSAHKGVACMQRASDHTVQIDTGYSPNEVPVINYIDLMVVSKAHL